jgi:excisionase family DNA binding protein
VTSESDLPTSPEELLTPARAAAIAERSVRTIRRAYSSGRLVAFRDGGGRGVRISYADLRRWLLCEEIAPTETPSHPDLPSTAPTRGNVGQADHLALIHAAREHHRRTAGSAATRSRAAAHSSSRSIASAPR